MQRLQHRPIFRATILDTMRHGTAQRRLLECLQIDIIGKVFF